MLRNSLDPDSIEYLRIRNTGTEISEISGSKSLLRFWPGGDPMHWLYGIELR